MKKQKMFPYSNVAKALKRKGVKNPGTKAIMIGKKVQAKKKKKSTFESARKKYYGLK